MQNRSPELDTIITDVNQQTSPDQKINTLVNGVASQITRLKNEPEELQRFADQLKSRYNELSSSFSQTQQGRSHTSGSQH